MLKFTASELNAKKRRLGRVRSRSTLARARQAFEDIQFTPSILRDVSSVDTSRTVLGGPVAQPFGIAPTGFTRMMQTEGEIAGATAAANAASQTIGLGASSIP